MTQWEVSNVISGFSTVINLKGPQLSSLTRPKSLEIFINDVPTSFDIAGNVLKVENFEWLFICKSETKTVDDKITYTYSETPIRVEQCNVCKGVGHIEYKQQCSKCGGEGKFVALDKKTYTCDRCDGTGKETVQKNCSSCGGDGAMQYPKSAMPPISSEVVWTGYIVDVITTPPGATVSVYDREKNKYVDRTSPVQVEWVQTGSDSYPIKVTYNRETIKVVPYSPNNNKALSKIVVDFSNGSIFVKSGSRVN
jgi:ribosomal protein S27AE